MKFPFDPRQGLIIVRAVVRGPSQTGALRLALDTGAKRSLFNTAPLILLGYAPSNPAHQRVRIMTAIGVGSVPEIRLDETTSLGKNRSGFPVLCNTFPPGTAVDGLLGVDFLRGMVLTLDFIRGEITVV